MIVMKRGLCKTFRREPSNVDPSRAALAIKLAGTCRNPVALECLLEIAHRWDMEPESFDALEILVSEFSLLY
jgi:hypothetical protein